MLLNTLSTCHDPASSQGIYLLDVQDGAIGWADEDGAVVIDVDDLDVKHGGPPKRGMPLVRGHHSQVEPLIGLQAPPGCDKPGVFIDLESLWGQKNPPHLWLRTLCAR